VKSVLGIVCIALHAGLLVSIVQFLDYPLWLWSIDFTSYDADPRQMNEIAIRAFFPLVIGVIGGLVGVFLAWFVFRKEKFRPIWMIVSVRVAAIPWVLLIPIGPFIAIFLYRCSNADTPSCAAT